MIRKKISATAVIALCAASSAVALATPAGAAVTTPAACAPNDRRIVTHTGTFYKSIGSAVGKYNSSPLSDDISYGLSITKTQSSAWEAGATASVSFGIGSVEASTDYTVTKTTTLEKSIVDKLSVPGHYYGYDQPKAEFRTYHIYDLVTEPNCQTKVEKNYSYFDAITADPFFSSCVAKSACTPKP